MLSEKQSAATIKRNKEKAEDIVGKKFGNIIVLEELPYKNPDVHVRRFLCKCDCCGKLMKIQTTTRVKKQQSCGCLRNKKAKEYHTTHGLSNTKIWGRYKHMVERCYKKYHKSYKDYGGRGITVCNEWLGENGFINFYNWAIENGYDENKPTYYQTLERINNDLGYSPTNCRFASLKEQALNRRNTIKITYMGETKTVSEWSEIIGVKESTIRNRLYKNMDIERVLTPGNLRYQNLKCEKQS